MADLLINVDLSSDRSEGKAKHENRKHKKFLRRRKFLERRGFLNQKQLPNKLPGKDPGQAGNPRDHNKQNGQADGKNGARDRTGRQTNVFHQQGAPDTSSRTVSMGTAHQSSTLSVSISCAPSHHRPATPSKGHNTTATDGAKKPAKPMLQQLNLLSEYESCLPPAVSTPSYKMVAIDCEMVGTGQKGRNSALARCSIVNYQGDVVYDKYIKPPCPVTDYRTRWSGIRRAHLVNAIPFPAAQKEILKLLHGKIVIGHAIQNDYKALGYFHPKEMTRDTSKIPHLNRKAGFPENEPASLKRLAKQILNKKIQMGRSGHSSVEDAKTTMELYRVIEAEYEMQLAAGTVPQ
ncbi:interferon-stimulated 20 kDa exonuclease-like 2 [Bufo bufo]|uniref:interferon-stimulated 20 kDa exonuclease-like 2 n=1 Tax=Bufo bufo TaxID=8384 RepID=UPI001ABDBEE3|nr:interferon-stimulated 20 kDa exonuclease-like 2 [Bufo bufo]XP_040266845.1 interferon-stimulated 20 kDa exonuclease-like 2 [Bufo bufo]